MDRTVSLISAKHVHIYSNFLLLRLFSPFPSECRVRWVFIQLCDPEYLEGFSVSACCWGWGRSRCHQEESTSSPGRNQGSLRPGVFPLSANARLQPCQALMCLDLNFTGKVTQKASYWDSVCSLSGLACSRWAISVQKAVWNHRRITNRCGLW